MGEHVYIRWLPRVHPHRLWRTSGIIMNNAFYSLQCFLKPIIIDERKNDYANNAIGGRCMACLVLAEGESRRI